MIRQGADLRGMKSSKPAPLEREVLVGVIMVETVPVTLSQQRVIPDVCGRDSTRQLQWLVRQPA